MGASILAQAAVAGAQTRFAWPAHTVDLSRYTMVEACLAATRRIDDSVNVPRRFDLAGRPKTSDIPALPQVVIDAARRCSAQWPASTVTLVDYPLLLRLYIQAGRDADVNLLVQRRLGAVAVHDDSSLAVALESTADVYLSTVPYQITSAERIIALYARLPRTTMRVFRRIDFLSDLLSVADRCGDTLRARSAATQLTQLSQTIAETDKATAAWTDYRAYRVWRAIDYLTRLSQLDSLRRSTASYVALVRANWAKVGSSPTSPIGERAPTLLGDFWFEPGIRHPVAPNGPQPAPGAISLITFLDDCHIRVSQCWESYAALERIHQQFPDVALTIVTQTKGFFLDQEPPTADTEAELYRHWWLDVRQLPATLVVETTPFFRLPAPDRRRVNQATADRTNYSFGHRWNPSQKSFLLDRDGVIVEWAVLDRDSEQRFNQSLRVLENRVRE